MWQTLGHQNQKVFLENALKSQAYSHAYLFCGPSHVGKRTMALEFAHKILGVASENAKRLNPDLIVIDNQVKIEDMRRLIANLSLKPYQYKWKVAIIDNFENVNDEAANSILKTLEEPNSSTIIILITNNKKAILPTILSRAQTIFFNRASADQLAEVAGESKALEYFDGKIGKAIMYMRDKKYQQEILANFKELAALRANDQPSRIMAIKDYAELENADLQSLFENWLDNEHYAIRQDPVRYKNLALIIEAIQALKQNFNKKLILQKLFLHLS